MLRPEKSYARWWATHQTLIMSNEVDKFFALSRPLAPRLKVRSGTPTDFHARKTPTTYGRRLTDVDCTGGFPKHYEDPETEVTRHERRRPRGDGVLGRLPHRVQGTGRHRRPAEGPGRL